jgi:glycine/D-amino acid oxidase-like deaminating enzyme
MNIAIIGGGIAGLSLAMNLHRVDAACPRSPIVGSLDTALAWNLVANSSKVALVIASGLPPDGPPHVRLR